MICKKRTFLAALLLLGLPFILAQCGKPICSESNYYEHLVEGYYRVASINVESETVAVNGTPYVRLTVGAMHNGEKIEKMEYEQLSQKHGETGGEHWALFDHFDVFPSEDFNAITITAIDDWDADHKAGTCLNEMVHFIAYSVYPYIRNGYSALPDEGSASEFRRCANCSIIPHSFSNAIDKALGSVTEDDLILIGGGFTLKLFDLFIPQNEAAGPCRIKISVNDIAGKEFSTDITVTAYTAL